MKLTLDLTEDEWAEIPAALETKIHWIKDGDDEARISSRDAQWVATLRSAFEKITNKMQLEGIPW